MLGLLLGMTLLTASTSPFQAKPIQGQPPANAPQPAPPLKPNDTTWSLDDSTMCDIHLELKFRESKVEYPTDMTCGWTCKGKVHTRHEECDHKCDTPCQAKHKLDLSPDGWADGLAARDQFPNDLTKFGASCAGAYKANGYGPNISLVFDGWFKAIKDDPKRSLKKTYAHWCDDPCSSSYATYIDDIFDVSVTLKLFRDDTAPDGRKIRVDGPTETFRAGSVYVPRIDSVTFSKPYVACRCKIVMTQEESEWRQLIDEREKRETEEKAKKTPKQDPPAGVINKETGMNLGPADLEKCQFAVTCQDVNQATCSATNPYSWPVTLVVNPGTVCVSEDDEFQWMCLSSLACSSCRRSRRRAFPSKSSMARSITSKNRAPATPPSCVSRC